MQMTFNTMPIATRIECCEMFIKNNFDFGKTIGWMQDNHSDYLISKRGGAAENVAYQIISMGANGAQHQLNVEAMREAVRRHVEHQLNGRQKKNEDEIEALRKQNAELQNDLNRAHKDNNQTHRDNEKYLNQLRESERTVNGYENKLAMLNAAPPARSQSTPPYQESPPPSADTYEDWR